MAEDTQSVHQTRAKHRSVMVIVWLALSAATLWFGALAALLGGLWMLFKPGERDGIEITLILPDASGVHEGASIKLLNVEVGSVVNVSLNEQRNGVVAKARMKASTEDFLNEDAKFWLGKPHIDRSGITGLNSLVSSYIEMSPGAGGAPKREFTVLDVKPAGGDGAYFQLSGEAGGNLLLPGAPVLYRNMEVGEVAEANFDPHRNTTAYRIFIRRPNAALIGENTYFWAADVFHADVDDGELNIDVPSVTALLSGGSIAFDNPQPAGKGEDVPENSAFVLHRNDDMLGKVRPDDAFRVAAFFDQSVASLHVGSPVVYKGVTVGFVDDPQFFDAGGKAKLFAEKTVPVAFHLSPDLFGEDVDPAQWRKSVREALDRGLTATIGISNLLLGRGRIELTDGAGGDALKPAARYRDLPVMGTRKSGVDDVVLQVNALLEKINRLPLEKTVAELNRTLTHIARISGGKDTQALPRDVHDTLAQLQKTLGGVSPDAPLYHEIRKTLDAVNEALERAEPLLRILDEKPNALIFDDKRSDPVPKGRK